MAKCQSLEAVRTMPRWAAGTAGHLGSAGVGRWVLRCGDHRVPGKERWWSGRSRHRPVSRGAAEQTSARCRDELSESRVDGLLGTHAGAHRVRSPRRRPRRRRGGVGIDAAWRRLNRPTVGIDLGAVPPGAASPRGRSKCQASANGAMADERISELSSRGRLAASTWTMRGA